MMLCRHATEGIILDGSQSQPKSSERQRCYPTVTSNCSLGYVSTRIVIAAASVSLSASGCQMSRSLVASFGSPYCFTNFYARLFDCSFQPAVRVSDGDRSSCISPIS